MPISLAEAKNNAQEDIDVHVIDEFRKNSAFLDALPFDPAVNPAGGGATLTYGYRRQITQASADVRELNTEYTPNNVTTKPYTTDLKVLGGAFEVDRVIANIGPAASGAVELNLRNKIKAASAKFIDEAINGDEDRNDNPGFDGLSKALRGSDTEVGLATVSDWSNLDSDASKSQKILDQIDDLLSLLNGAPTLLVGNDRMIMKIRAVARRAGVYVKSPVDGLVSSDGRPIEREVIGNGLVLVDAGAKAGSNDRIIPIVSRDLDNTKYNLEVTGSPTGGSFTLKVTIDGDEQETDGIAHNASNADIKAALEALSNVPKKSVTVTGTGTKTIEFAGGLKQVVVNLALGTNSLSGGSTPGVTIAEQAVVDNEAGVTDLYAVRFDTLDGFTGVSTVGGQLVQTFLPDFSSPGAVKKGEVEMGPVSVALKATKAAAVLRNIRL